MEDEEEFNQIKIGNYILYNQRIENHGLKADYVAKHNNENKYFICKIISKEEIEDNISLDEIQKTISIHKKLDHDNIVKLYDLKEDQKYLYIFFLDFIDGNGKTLSKIISNNIIYKFEEKEIFIIIEQITNLLIYLYDNKIIMKDLLLRNIFIEQKEENNEKMHILLCNLEHRALLSQSTDKNEIEYFYNKIVYKLGIIICVLLDYEFYKYFKKNINKQDLINEYIEKNILNKLEIAENIKNLIIHMVLLGEKQRIHLKNIPLFGRNIYRIRISFEGNSNHNKDKSNDNNSSLYNISDNVFETNKKSEGENKEPKINNKIQMSNNNKKDISKSSSFNILNIFKSSNSKNKINNVNIDLKDDKIKQIESLYKNIKELNNKIKQLEKENKQLKDEIKRVKKDNIKLKEMREENINLKKKYENDVKKLNNIIIESSNKYKDLERQLNEQKLKSKDIFSNDSKDEIMQLIKELKSKNDELKMIKSKIGFDIKENEQVISIIFISMDQKIHHSFICKDSDKLYKIEGLLYEYYPEYKNSENFFLIEGNKINKFNTMKENNIKNNSIITLIPYDENNS